MLVLPMMTAPDGSTASIVIDEGGEAFDLVAVTSSKTYAETVAKGVAASMPGVDAAQITKATAIGKDTSGNPRAAMFTYKLLRNGDPWLDRTVILANTDRGPVTATMTFVRGEGGLASPYQAEVMQMMMQYASGLA